MIEEIFLTTIEAVAKLKDRADELENNLSTLASEVNGFEDDYAKNKEDIKTELDGIYLLIDKKISDIKIPEAINGIDGVNGKDGSDGKDGKDGLTPIIDYDFIISQIIPPEYDDTELKRFIKDRLKKIDSELEAIATNWFNENKDSLKGESIKGDKGDRGQSGADGISIVDIYEKKEVIYIELSNGIKKSFKIPSKTVTSYVGGGGASFNSTPFNNRNEIEGAFKYAYLKSFKEMIYSGIVLVGVDIYSDDTKTTKLFTKTFIYDDESNLTTVTTTDESNGNVLIKTINYLDGNVSSIENDIIIL